MPADTTPLTSALKKMKLPYGPLEKGANEYELPAGTSVSTEAEVMLSSGKTETATGGDEVLPPNFPSPEYCATIV